MIHFKEQRAIECLFTAVDSNNVEYSLFFDYKNRPAVRVWDLDDDSIVGLSWFTSLESAEAKYDEYVLNSKADSRPGNR